MTFLATASGLMIDKVRSIAMLPFLCCVKKISKKPIKSSSKEHKIIAQAFSTQNI
ncbi:hypothetical protein GCM10009007_19760 [Formosimonas limnophila]|uniref:Uncharacterized protein n=1 Tax=Formosimonas limnophila TaxID=1384487 RepID=A0A8J3CP34_9BURK|nr:hypothetical protein GCM10009007_19760 [Formosimonas limnophila]